MKGHYYAVNPVDIANAICSNGNVLEEVACYVYDPTQPPPSGTAKFYRIYDKVGDFRFYTANEVEALQLLQNQQQYAPDGFVGYVYWSQQPSGTTELYRLRNVHTNDHLFTTHSDEKNNLVGPDWADEGPACFVFDPRQVDPGQVLTGIVPLYRLFKNY